jgi:hypothetical protein
MNLTKSASDASERGKKSPREEAILQRATRAKLKNRKERNRGEKTDV